MIFYPATIFIAFVPNAIDNSFDFISIYNSPVMNLLTDIGLSIGGLMNSIVYGYLSYIRPMISKYKTSTIDQNLIECDTHRESKSRTNSA
jgi:hypothetical protein